MEKKQANSISATLPSSSLTNRFSRLIIGIAASLVLSPSQQGNTLDTADIYAWYWATPFAGSRIIGWL